MLMLREVRAAHSTTTGQAPAYKHKNDKEVVLLVAENDPFCVLREKWQRKLSLGASSSDMGQPYLEGQGDLVSR